ncbi:MAG: dihydrofolate reductase [Desulfuromonas sp.]|nr:dihydrofolate reductase [Desulfuromonas sp.]
MFTATGDDTAGRPHLGIVVAMTRDGIIGDQGGLPWDLPADRRLFRLLTEGNTVIMGRRTFESLPAALTNRHNIVISRGTGQLPGAAVCRSFLEGVALGWRLGRPIFVIGGTDIYRKALPIADTLHISWVTGKFSGDRRFPPFDLTAWVPVSTTDYPGFRHVIYRRAAQPLPGQSPYGNSP